MSLQNKYYKKIAAILKTLLLFQNYEVLKECRNELKIAIIFYKWQNDLTIIFSLSYNSFYKSSI